jgi:hypothetical protein
MESTLFSRDGKAALSAQTCRNADGSKLNSRKRKSI